MINKSELLANIGKRAFHLAPRYFTKSNYEVNKHGTGIIMAVTDLAGVLYYRVDIPTNRPGYRKSYWLPEDTTILDTEKSNPI